MSRPGWPWDDLYRRALRAGIGDETFWTISPRAVMILADGK